MMIASRRIAQIVFLLLFLLLFFQAQYPYDHWLPADLFLRASPLVVAATIIAGRLFIPSLMLAFVG